MTGAVALEQGRTAFAEHRWSDACSFLSDADADNGLTPEDLERLSTAAFLLGDDVIGIETAQKAHQELLALGDVVAAARCAAWLGVTLISMGDLGARSSGWLARAQRVIEEANEPTSVPGLLLVPAGLGMLYQGDQTGAARAFDEAFAIGKQFRDADLMALAQLGQGQARIMRGDLNQGVSLFDEAMVAVTAGEIAPIPSGIVYCGVIGNCHRAFDVRRAQEWTVALDHWCGDRPDMVLFSGQCQMHRAQLYFLHGAWNDAIGAARAAQNRARRGDGNAVYGGWYQQAEIQRLRGDYAGAEESYRRAGQSGFEPEPGLALLRLAQGEPQLAQTLINRAVESSDPATRRHLLPGLIEIALAVGDVEGARRGADELGAMSDAVAMPLVQAIANQCEAAVLLAEGDPHGALNRLRRGWANWQELDAPYEAARCRLLAARAYRALGDDDSVLMELEPARTVFAELGAAPALAEMDAWSRAGSEDAAGPLTAREIEVLRLVCEGKTNRAIAAQLYLSEKTVARHLSNMFTKLGLSSRSAATAYAYEHRLV